ncbi:MAG: metallophosphoesterase [Bdellovibrionaceae bacterium]|nr:metallophosphoesterase [Bdellovibrio sp.]
MKRYVMPLVIITLIFGLIHYFIFKVITRSIPEETVFNLALATWFILSLLLMPVGFVISSLPLKKFLYPLTWYGYIWLGFFQIIIFFALIEALITIFYSHPYSYWILITSLLISVWALYKGLKRPTLIRHKISGPASIKGLTLVQISDLHVGLLHLNQKWLESVVKQVNELNADIVAITGDLVEGAFSEIAPKLECLKSVSARLEKYYVTGNHEYIHGSGPWEKRLVDLGYRNLHNENHVLTFRKARILIAGVPDRMVPRFDPKLKSNPDLALKINQDVDYRILLAHEPASVHDIKLEKCDLILSGHTHGGQIFPFGVLVRLVQPLVKGFKRFGSTLVFAHQGTGLWGPPMRWFTRSEIVLIEWE